MTKFVTIATAGDAEVKLTAEVTIPSTLPQAVRKDATDRINYLLRREAERIAEIAFVDAVDAKAEPAELERIRNADPNRGHTIVQAGTRDLVESGKVHVSDAVQVVKGSIEAHGQTLTEKGRA